MTAKALPPEFYQLVKKAREPKEGALLSSSTEKPLPTCKKCGKIVLHCQCEETELKK